MVIPVWDKNPTRHKPFVTYVLIALNVAVFLLQPIARGTVSGDVRLEQACRQEAFYNRWGAIPKELLSNDDLEVTTGAPVPPDSCLVVPRDYEKVPFLSSLTAMFLHGGWAHLLGNMLFLFVFGNNVEDRLGSLRFLLAYLAWGVVATYVFAVPNAGSESVVIGASGAIAGVLGAYLVMFPKARVVSLVPILFFIPIPLPAWIVLGMWFVLQGVYAAGSTITEGASVAFLAHVAGFVAGFLTARVLRRRA